MILLTTTLGLEGAVSKEVKKYGYRVVDSLTGRVLVEAKYEDIPFFNINIRTAERILYVVGTFKAESFDELYENIKSLDLSFLPKNPYVRVSKVRTVNSKLYSAKTIQSISMKALADKLKNVDGKVPYSFHVYARKNTFIIAIDTTGKDSLHMRGYRKKYSKAPLRETIAASLLILSRYNGSSILYDPFCGSGTIAIEGYLIAKNIPPNLNRSFYSENWPELKNLYKTEREKSVSKIKPGSFDILCSDIDEDIIKICKENAKRASAKIRIFKEDFKKAKASKDFGIIVSNPPYGMRIKDSVWKEMKTLFKNFPRWSINLISPYKNPQKFVGKPADKTTPFLNSGVKVFFVQYFKRG